MVGDKDLLSWAASLRCIEISHVIIAGRLLLLLVL